MGEEYLYNPQTDKLHIRGYCQHVRKLCAEYIIFATEDEALAYDGRAVSMCKLCQKRRNKILQIRKEV